jgi:hypothetical protein
MTKKNYARKRKPKQRRDAYGIPISEREYLEQLRINKIQDPKIREALWRDHEHRKWIESIDTSDCPF